MNLKSLSTTTVGAGLLFATAALRIIFMMSNSNLIPLNVIYYLALVCIGVGLMMKNYVISIAGAAIDALIEFYWVIQTVKYEDPWQAIVYEFAYLAAFVLLIVLLLPFISDSMAASLKDLHQLWFLPGAILAVCYIPMIIYNSQNYYDYFTDSFKYIFTTVLFIAGVFFTGHSICNEPVISSGSAGLNVQAAPVQTPTLSPLSTTSTTQTVSAAQNSFSSDNFEMLRKYKELLDAGILTQEEFDEKKKDLLG